MELDAPSRAELIAVRPLLNQLATADDDTLDRLLLIERSLWECVNRERYLVYQHEWKEFYRRWQKDDVGQWPSSESFADQHRLVSDAAARFGLTPEPLATVSVREALYQKGVARVIVLTAASPAEIQAVAMPLETILP